jgi:plastocyanin
MSQQDTAFVPVVVTIPAGGTVSFPNADPFFHNVFSYSSAQRFDLGRYPQGETLVDEDRFRLGGVPPGTYTLAVWHPDHQMVEQRVEVGAGQTTRVEVALRR